MIRSSKKTARNKRAEQKVINVVRPIVAERDGRCRIAKDSILGVPWGLGFCEGVSEWAHLSPKKRFQTRKQAPELRHQTAWSVIFCSKHHRMYDAHQFEVEPESVEVGADGPLAYRLK